MTCKGQQCSLTVPDNETSQGAMQCEHEFNPAHAVHGRVPTWPAGTAVALDSLQAGGTVVAGLRGTLQDVQLAVGPLEAGVTAVTVVAVGHQTQQGISTASASKAPRQKSSAVSAHTHLCSHLTHGKVNSDTQVCSQQLPVLFMLCKPLLCVCPSLLLSTPEFCCWGGGFSLIATNHCYCHLMYKTLNPIPPQLSTLIFTGCTE